MSLMEKFRKSLRMSLNGKEKKPMKLTDILRPYRLIEKAKEQQEEDALYEGLTFSYSMLKTIQTVHSKLDCKTAKLRRDSKNFYNCFAVSGKIPFDFQTFLSILGLCGWYIAFIEFSDENRKTETLKKNISLSTLMDKAINFTHFQLKVEAKFDTEIDRKLWPSKLYCLAPLNVKNKIEKIGLVPKSGKNLDNQPERIYFAINRANLINQMLPQLKKNDNRYNDGAILITVDTDKFPERIKLYDDINWPGDAVYTIVNIPPRTIIDIEDL